MTTIDAGVVAEDRVAVASSWRLMWWRFRRHHLAMASAGLLIFLYSIVLGPDFFSTQDPERTDARQAFIPVQTVHLFDGGAFAPWVPAIVGKRNPTTLRMTGPRFIGRVYPPSPFLAFLTALPLNPRISPRRYPPHGSPILRIVGWRHAGMGGRRTDRGFGFHTHSSKLSTDEFVHSRPFK